MSVRNKIPKSVKKAFTIMKRLLTFNITTIMFGALLLYMIITVVLYATSHHVTAYQVTVGPLTKNPVCTALAIRSEQLVPADGSGYVAYYAREGMEVRKRAPVYGLNNEKKQAKNVELTEEQQEKIRSRMAKFSYGFDGNNFYDAYSFKYEIQGNLLQVAGVAAPGSDTSDEEETDTPVDDFADDDSSIQGEPVGDTLYLGNHIVYTAPTAGVVVYSTDGYEGKTADTLTEEDFNQKSYKKEELLTSEKIAKNDSVYKLITSERWTLMVPLTDKLAAAIAGRSSIKVKFIKDGESQNGALSIVNVGDQKIAKIELNNGMTRYAADRFLDIELVVNTRSGLKIPISSVVEKEFYKIPRSFLTMGDNEKIEGFLRENSKADGGTEFVDAVIYREVDAHGKEITAETQADPGGYCYVDKKTFKDGDILKKQDSIETFIVGDVDYLQGVYGMNKGYAMFRQIKMLDQNEEYCIVEQGTSYGLQAFDYIVLDGASVEEEDILYR